MVEEKKSHEILRSLFEELKDAVPIEEKSRASFNDGGTSVTTLWQLRAEGSHIVFFRTNYNDWSIDSPWTLIERVEPEFEVKWNRVGDSVKAGDRVKKCAN